MECEYCYKQYKSVSSLNHHKKTNKSCLSIRRNDKERILELEKLLREKTEELRMKNTIIQEKDEIIMDMAVKAVSTSRTTNITVNNKCNLQINNLSPDFIKNQVDTKFTEVHLLNGQKGVAIFTNQYLIRDEEGKPNYFCTDLGRRVFVYKNGQGFIEKDFKLEKLTNQIADGIIEKSCMMFEQIRPELTMDNYRESQYISNIAEIKNLKKDNTTFVTTLAGLACNGTTLEIGDIQDDDIVDDTPSVEDDAHDDELMKRFYEQQEQIRLSRVTPPQSNC